MIPMIVRSLDGQILINKKQGKFYKCMDSIFFIGDMFEMPTRKKIRVTLFQTIDKKGYEQLI